MSSRPDLTQDANIHDRIKKAKIPHHYMMKLPSTPESHESGRYFSSMAYSLFVEGRCYCDDAPMQVVCDILLPVHLYTRRRSMGLSSGYCHSSLHAYLMPSYEDTQQGQPRRKVSAVLVDAA
ncbi:hypothetical protein M378DRAFT_159159 [Amanita muscaria Koide BX008]|uniref:Uncharacterized protein n=1 Tax=Amanita muscaria (strain Koide BX008) TaxID=946122 RepID=A0A0C2XGA4_AMAMK|nr:hypothetical protein M378DRAFT_159159 [Amanita muscaria Koide BX008]